MFQPSMYSRKFWRDCQSGTPAEVILGSPNAKNCKNFGICRVSLEQGQVKGLCDNKTIAYLRIDTPTDRLLVHFLSCSFNQACGERFFQREYFRIDADYQLPKEVAGAIAHAYSNIRYRIEKGNYPVLIDDHFHTVSLRLARVEHTNEELPLAA